MISDSEQRILEKIVQDTGMTLQEIHTMLGKVYDDELALDLNRQAMRCSALRERAADYLLEAGIIPEPEGILARAGRWSSLQARTALNINTAYVAQLLAGEQQKRYAQFLETLENEPVSSHYACELAEEFSDFTQGSVRILKDYC